MRKAKNSWNSYSDIEIMVREATSNDPWGPSSSLMARICRESDAPADYNQMFSTLWKRVSDYQHMKHVSKALTLIEYLMRHSHEHFVSDIILRSDTIRRLKHYKFYDDGVDMGSEVRAKAAAIMAMIEDPDLLIKERQVAERTGDRIKGFSYEYANFYKKDSLPEPVERKEDNHFEPLPLEPDVDEFKYEEENKPKKKKKSKKGKKAKKVVEEEEPEETLAIMPAEEVKAEPKKTASLVDTDLVTGGMNYKAALDNLDWLGASVATHHLTQDIALFDMEVQPAQRGKTLESSDEVLLFEEEKAMPEAVEAPAMKKDVDVWDVAREITVLDNLNMTAQERSWADVRTQRKTREQSAPKLNQIAKPKMTEPMLALPDAATAWQPAQQQYAHDYSRAMVPYGSMPTQGVPQAQYGYPYGYPQYQYQYQWN